MNEISKDGEYVDALGVRRVIPESAKHDPWIVTEPLDKERVMKALEELGRQPTHKYIAGIDPFDSDGKESKVAIIIRPINPELDGDMS